MGEIASALTTEGIGADAGKDSLDEIARDSL